MRLALVEENIQEARVEEIRKAVIAGTMTKGAAIREMFVGGMETKNISNTLGIKYNHAYNVIKNEVLIHGLEVVTESRSGEGSKKQAIIEGLKAGKAIKDIAAEQKCMYNYVWQIGKAAGLVGKKKEETTVVAEPVAEEAPKPKAKAKAKKQVAVAV